MTVDLKIFFDPSIVSETAYTVGADDQPQGCQADGQPAVGLSGV
ncbi:hypothetical protein RMN56_10265 [Micromonospora halotolerans]|uniref:Uncharacterized protein n=1 Tax=Micromonospora halotolerans TaxID=709879 RepID=A0ABZ0A2P3_9ACTN|nr:hypothetical protein [Micromonospora halotolerans]WNM41692.1 hypothetical protein RMN56_10265 [Micromonospora halotolerans]